MADFQKLIKLLESQDLKTYEEAKIALRTHIDQGNYIKNLVNYYAENHSERALELLCLIREPQDRVLLDCLNECFARQKLPTIILLGQIIQNGPSWVPKIAFHPLFMAINKHMSIIPTHRPPEIKPEEISVLLFICNLLPFCSVLDKEILHSLFKTFVTSCEILRQKLKEEKGDDFVTSVHVSHLDFAVRQLFFFLYGIYPHNFMKFLRDTFFMEVTSDRSRQTMETRQRIYRTIVRPLTATVRLHPSILELTAEKELSKTRWTQREPHDFLDDCNKIMIGIIPLSWQLGEDDETEREDQIYPTREVYQTLFPSKSSAISSFDGNEGNGWHDGESTSTEIGGVDGIDTPPGSRPGTPVQKRSLDDSSFVLDGRRRRSTTSDEGRKPSFRQRLSKVLSRGERRSEQPPLIEVLNAEEERRRNSETNSQPDEAEEAGLEAEGGISPNSEAQRELQRATAIRDAAQAARRVVESRKSTTSASSNHSQIPPPLHHLSHDEDDLAPVARSRSTSFLCRTQQQREAALAKQDAISLCRQTTTATATTTSSSCGEGDHSQDHVGPDSVSMEGQNHRFSVTSFFKKYNRQRFRSECPPTEAVDGVAGGREEGESQGVPADMGLVPSGEKTLPPSASASAQSTLKRTYSCPTLVDEGAGMVGGGAGGDGGTCPPASALSHSGRLPQSPRTLPSKKDILEIFPYLMFTQEPSKALYAKLEAKLETDHEKERRLYINASKEFHATLKEMNLADRLPGRIYDDLSHILQGLPLDKQCNILRSRLMLVNQHLLYERSCRLLHANRNRRLFGRIKQQKVAEVELRNYREKEHEWKKQRDQFISALSDLRRSALNEQKQATATETTLCERIKALQEALATEQLRLMEARERRTQAEAAWQELKRKGDSQKRRADDAEEQLRLIEQRLRESDTTAKLLALAQRETQLLRDNIKILEESKREQSSLNDEKEEEKETRMHSLEVELERARRKMGEMLSLLEETRQSRGDADAAAKAESDRAQELRHNLYRAAKLLREQNEAAQQKFLSLQAVTQRQEEYIFQLLRQIEEMNDERSRRTEWGEEGNSISTSSRIGIPLRSVNAEIASYESSHDSDVAGRSLILSSPPPPVGINSHSNEDVLTEEMSRISL